MYGIIKQDMNCLTIEHPGTIRVGKKQMKRGGKSDPRNKGFMKMFNLIGIGECAGSDVPDLLGVWENEGWEEPLIEEENLPSRTILTLSFEKKMPKKSAEMPKKSAEKTKKKYEKILTLMEPKEWYKASELIKDLDIKERRTRELLNELVEKGILEEKGVTKGKRYRKNNKK